MVNLERKDSSNSNVAVVEELSHLIPALWRTLTRASRGSDRMPALESQVSILHRLVEHGELSPAQLADMLHVTRPTVSGLVKGLVAEGIVERHPSPTDGRSVVLVATPHGREILSTFRSGRAEVLSEALDAVPDDDVRVIKTALPSLAVLLSQLEVMSAAKPA